MTGNTLNCFELVCVYKNTELVWDGRPIMTGILVHGFYSIGVFDGEVFFTDLRLQR